MRSRVYETVRCPSVCLSYSLHGHTAANPLLQAVVKFLGKRWRIPVGARLEGPKLEPEGPTALLGFQTADQGFASIKRTLLGFCGI